ncbi:MAG: PA14 domain-containing protein, partial [Litorilinea sp.]
HPEPQRPEPQRPDHKPERPEHKPDQPAKPTGHWVGSYYAGKYFENLVETREDAEIRFNWYNDSPAGLPEDRFSIRWERAEHFQPGWYRFSATADDGVRVFIDDTLVIDGWKIQPATEYTAEVYLTGGSHKLNVDYFEESDHAQIQVSYERLHSQPPVIKR